MKRDKLNSRQSLDTMSLATRQPPPQKSSEREYLAVQAASARTAMSRTLYDIKETLKRMVNVSACAKQHPWLVTGSAVAVGFVTGAVLTPTRDKNVKKTRSNSEAGLQPGAQGQESVTPRKSVLFSALGTMLAETLKAVVQRAFAAAVIAKDRVETQAPHDSVGVITPESGPQ